MLAGEAVPEALASHVRHHVEDESVRVPGIVERQDVGMLELRGRLDLRQEALGAHERGELRSQHLERHLPLVT